ncbi:autophagy-related protein 17 [Pelomyxa schiedti]|nr:autophagy-related protein 17 [Pelomyxa schiedti]
MFAQVYSLSRLVNHQVRSLCTLSEWLSIRDGVLKTHVLNMEALLATSLSGIDSALVPLKEKVLDRSLKATCSRNPETLFDFVDSDHVNELKQKAQDSCQAIKASTNSSQIEKEFMNSKICVLSQKYKECHIDESAISLAREKITTQATELSILKDLFISLATIYDQVTNLVIASSSKGFMELLEAMTTSESKIELAASEVDSLQIKADDAFKKFVDILSMLEEMNMEIQIKLKVLDDLDIQLKIHTDNAQQNFECLNQLEFSYKEYLKSYLALIEEIRRRHNEHARHQAIADHCSEKLNALFSVEVQLRKLFEEKHGGFLPSTICPAITEEPTHYLILPKTFTTNLPMVEAPVVVATSQQPPTTPNTTQTQTPQITAETS